MKVTRGISAGIAIFMLTAVVLAEPSHTLDEAIHEVLLPGTTIVAGDDPKDNDFYVATDDDAVKIVENQKLAKIKMEAAVGAKGTEVLAEKNAQEHAQEHKNIQIDPKLLATLNVDTKQVLDKYAAYESKATIADINERVSTQQFEPVVVASADKEQGPPIEKQAVTDYPLEPVFSATPKKPVKKAVVAEAKKTILADASSESEAHPLEPLLSVIPKETTTQSSSKPSAKKTAMTASKKAKPVIADKTGHAGKKVAINANPVIADKSRHTVKKTTIATAKKSIMASVSKYGIRKTSHTVVATGKSHSRQVHAHLKSSHKQALRTTIAAHTPKAHKKLAAGVVKPYVPGKTVHHKHMLAVRQSSKYVVKTVSFDRHHRLKLVSAPKGQKGQRLSSNNGVKNRSRYQFKVIHLYR